MSGMAGPERRGPERPGPDYPPEWDAEPIDDRLSECPWRQSVETGCVSCAEKQVRPCP